MFLLFVADLLMTVYVSTFPHKLSDSVSRWHGVSPQYLCLCLFFQVRQLKS